VQKTSLRRGFFVLLTSMRVVVFSAKGYDRDYLSLANKAYRTGNAHSLTFLDSALDETTAALAQGFDAVCVFVNDRLTRDVLRALTTGGVRLIALRCAGFNNVDLAAAKEFGLVVARVPAYSPHAVAEHAVALLLTLNRKIHRAYNRVRDGNFALNGLAGFDLAGKTVAVVGTGKIGRVFAEIMLGFGCQVLAFDQTPSDELTKRGVRYVPFGELLSAADVISLHCPLDTQTRHLFDHATLFAMKAGAILVNTGRGALIDTKALVEVLKSKHLGGVCMDVYEEEEHLFFEDHSGEVLEDDVFARLLTFPNVLITAHQGFLTKEALTSIAEVTLTNIDGFSLAQPERMQLV
jgi:D-lactate dehydrogenase